MSFLLLACALCAPARPAVADARAGWDIERLMSEMRKVKTAKARFVERKQLAVLSKPIEFSGTLLYTAPDHLEKHTLRPGSESMILEGDTLTVSKTEGGPQRSFPLREFPLIWAFVESIRSTLAGDLDMLRGFYDVSLSGTESRWRLLLKPAVPKMRELVTEIRIEGSGNAISSVTVLEAGGDRSTMTITPSAP
jgi:hypothetical protein